MYRLNHLLYILILVAVLPSCKSTAVHHIHQKYDAATLKADVTTLRNILEANHPSLYWYTPKDSIDWYFDNVYNNITDSMTEDAFRKRISWAVSHIRCGHTSVRPSKQYVQAIAKTQPPVFPLAIKAWDDSLVVLSSAFRGDSVFKRGTIILSINNRTPQQLLDSMFQFISTDGYARNFQNQLASFNFGYTYRNAFGNDSMHLVKFLDTAGKERTVYIRNYDPRSDTITRKGTMPVKPVNKPDRRIRKEIALANKRSLTIDTAMRTAYIRVATFSSGRLKKFFRHTFRTIEQLQLKHVVLDVRENGGGNIMSSTRLTQYLVDKPFKLADTLAAISRRYHYGRYIHPSWIYRFSMMFTTHRKRSDGRYHFGYMEKHYFKPKKKNHFNGDVYIIQGGYSFSATTLFVHALKGQQNVTVVGEESGGGAYGNSAIHLPQIVLPNTQLRIVLPAFRLVMDASQPKNGRGIMPDVEIKPSSVAIRQGIDLKIAAVKEMIRKKQ